MANKLSDTFLNLLSNTLEGASMATPFGVAREAQRSRKMQDEELALKNTAELSFGQKRKKL